MPKTEPARVAALEVEQRGDEGHARPGRHAVLDQLGGGGAGKALGGERVVARLGGVRGGEGLDQRGIAAKLARPFQMAGGHEDVDLGAARHQRLRQGHELAQRPRETGREEDAAARPGVGGRAQDGDAGRARDRRERQVHLVDLGAPGPPGAEKARREFSTGPARRERAEDAKGQLPAVELRQRGHRAGLGGIFGGSERRVGHKGWSEKFAVIRKVYPKLAAPASEISGFRGISRAAAS